ncbi:MAG TPA: hypothetical protein PKK23_08175 [Nitrospirales bacterium]|nr:hypothetical protein [Nitrospirales bacterium]
MIMPAKFVVTVTYEALMGHPSTEEELIKEVSEYQQDDLIHLFCLFNHFLDTWQGGVNDDSHNFLINA